MPAAVSLNSVSRNVFIQMFFFHIHVHCITYNSEINDSYSSYRTNHMCIDV